MHPWGLLLTTLIACDGGDNNSSGSGSGSGGGSEQGRAAAAVAQQAVEQAQQAAATPPPTPTPTPALPEGPGDGAVAAVGAGGPGKGRLGRGGWKPLYPRQASATSFLKSNWNKYNENYHPNYAFDDNPQTAWVEGAEGNGEGEVLFIPLSSLSSAKRVKLRIRNGYQKSESLLEANAAPREIRVSLEQSHDPRAEGTFSLTRTMGWQEVELALPPGAGLDRVRLEVLSVHPGSKYTDTCISDIEVLVDSEVRYNGAQEKAHRSELLGWVGERVRTAKYFASQAAGYPFVSSQFDTDYQDAQSSAVAGAMRQGQALLSKMQRRDPLYKMTATHQIPVAPDGLYVTDGLLPYFTPGELKFHPNSDELAAHEKKSDEDGGYEMWSQEIWRSNVRVDWLDKPGGAFSTVYFWEKTIEQGRGTYEYKTEYVVHYGEDGVLDWVYSSRVGSGEIGQEITEELTTFIRRGNKIVPESRQSLTRYPEQPDASDYAAITRYRS